MMIKYKHTIFCKWKEVIQEGPIGAQNVKIELSYAHLDFSFSLRKSIKVSHATFLR